MDNWTIETDKYLSKRISWNKSKIGEFGFGIYLTQGASSTYVGWTKDTSYTIDTSQYEGIYDGVIIKSAYSIWKNNASDGYKIVFDIPDQNEYNESDFSISFNNSSITLNVGDTFSELGSSDIQTVKLKGTDITSEISNLSVITSSITNNIAPAQITEKAGEYTVKYSVSFRYKSKPYTKSISQSVTVK